MLKSASRGGGVCLLRGGLVWAGSAPGGGCVWFTGGMLWGGLWSVGCVWSGGRGVSARGVSCLVWGACSQGVSALGGLWSGGRVLPGGVLSGLVGPAPRGSLLWGVSGPGGLWSGGWCLLWGGCLVWGGVCVVGGVSAPGGYIPACTEADTPPPRGQTDACENITLAQLRCGR